MSDPKAKIAIAADDQASPVIRRVRAEIAGMKDNVSALTRVVGPLGAQIAGAFTVAAVGAWINRTIEGVDALNDLKDATGASIEKLSALEDVALRTGTSVESAGAAVVKLNQALNAASDPDSDAAKAIRAIGLSVDELKRMDPVDALQAVGRALADFRDDGNKGRIILELLGKSARELAPLLKDLAEAGELQAKVTTEQAEEAEKLRKEWSSLQKDALDLSRVLVGPFVSSMNRVIAKIREARGWWETLKAIDASAGILAGGKSGPEADYSGFAKTADSWGGGKPALADIGGDDDKARAKARAAADKALADRLRLAEFAAQQLVDIEEQAAKDAADAWKVWEKIQIADHDERAKAFELQWKQVFETIDAEQDRAIEEGQALLDSLADKGSDVADELALVFSSAAGEAITHWQGVRGLLKGILQDIAQIALRETVTKPLESSISGGLKGFDFGKLFSGGSAGGTNWGSLLDLFGGSFGGGYFAHGAAFDAAGIRRFAGGDVFGTPTLFRYGGGRTGLMGEAGPEAVMPLKRGADGRLGVAGGGGHTFVFNVAPGATVDDWRRSQRQVSSDLQRSLRRAGAIA